MDPTRRLPDQALEIGVMDRETLDSEEEDGSSDDEGDGGGGLEDAEPGPVQKRQQQAGRDNGISDDKTASLRRV